MLTVDGKIKAYAFGKYPVTIKDIYDDFGKIWTVCETENKSTEEYLFSDLTFDRRQHRSSLVMDHLFYTEE